MKGKITGLIIMVALLSACTREVTLAPTSTPTKTPTVTPSNSPTPRNQNKTVTAKATATITLTPDRSTATPRPVTYTPTRIPFASKTPPYSTPTMMPTNAASGLKSGRLWFIFHRWGSGQLGGFNLDGTGLTWFGLPGVFTMYELEFGVWHEWIAYTSQNPDTGLFELVVARFPGGELKAQIPITEEEYDPKIKYIGDLDWSPDGELLVVSAMRDSENTDLYLYRKYGSYLERITFEGGWAYEPRWSPDGKLIVYKEFVDAGCGLYLIHRHEYNLETKENIIVDTDDISSGGCGMGPQAFHIEATDTTGKYKAILCIYCGPYNEGEGVYIQGPGDEEPRLVYRVEEYIDRATLRWEKVARRFIVSFNSNWLVFNREGSLEYKAKDLHISPDGSMVALVDHYDILTVYRMDNGLHELWSVTDPPFVNLALWIPNSDMLLVQAWSHIYHLDVSEQSVNIIGYNLAGGFDIYEGYWLSQNP